MEHAATLSRSAAYVRLLRPRHALKNTFVLAGVAFAHQITNVPVVVSALLAFLAFSLTASGIYVLNDYVDRDVDRRHPTKRYRPLASGVVSPLEGLLLGSFCLCTGMLTAWAASPRVLAIVAGYFAINVAYSLWLKRMAVVDVFCIASGFMLRIMAGTWGIGIAPSRWMLLTGLFLTLFLGFAKRRAEWRGAQGDNAQRAALGQYNLELLDKFLSITATGTVLCYGLYTLDAATVALHGTGRLIYTVPFVLFGLFRYMLLLHATGKGEDPTHDLFVDRQIIATGAAFVAVTLWVLS